MGSTHDADSHREISTTQPFCSRWVLQWRSRLGGIAGVVLLVFLEVACPYVPRTGSVGRGVRIVFALCTIGVPGWFFIESVYGVDDTKRCNSDIDLKSRKDELKAMQEAARSVRATKRKAGVNDGR